jgi:hypothetical protein
MPHRKEQPTLFELTVCDELEPHLEPALEPAAPTVTLKSDPSRREGNVSPSGPRPFRAASPWTSLPLHEVCAACRREISGGGFVILDYEELGAFCDQDCADKRFRSYLHEVSEEGTF